MSERPVFEPKAEGEILVEDHKIEFTWHPGFSKEQKQKSIKSLHLEAKKKKNLDNILEVSTKSEINLVDLLNELVNLFQKEDLKIIISSRSKKINFTCDEIKIRQVFVNLINNAYEAKKESNSCEIEIRLRKTKNAVILNFIDNGIGFNDDINIFEPYVTTKKTGTGLGLAVVKKIIDEHDGSIAIKNNKISGANVEIHFSY